MTGITSDIMALHLKVKCFFIDTDHKTLKEPPFFCISGVFVIFEKIFLFKIACKIFVYRELWIFLKYYAVSIIHFVKSVL